MTPGTEGGCQGAENGPSDRVTSTWRRNATAVHRSDVPQDRTAGAPSPEHHRPACVAGQREPAECAPVLVLGLFSAVLMAGAGAGGALEEQAFFFPLTPLVTVTPPAIPAKRSSLLLV